MRWMDVDIYTNMMICVKEHTQYFVGFLVNVWSDSVDEMHEMGLPDVMKRS